MQHGESMNPARHGVARALHAGGVDGVVLPVPTAWPRVLALGVTLVIAGMVTHWVISNGSPKVRSSNTLVPVEVGTPKRSRNPDEARMNPAIATIPSTPLMYFFDLNISKATTKESTMRSEERRVGKECRSR